ncbi:electron transfer flavoprotein subunit alpha/FixB family protein [Peribacillus aracenensis]|uniref:electron transfer flavoprotein subunit alpha/FixB family protein n=1 Tax=Peribacillus aracenensis TaxID=2976708 RepID=UPI0021A7BA8F|nr:electron transfer flavoprotein subunit alpha/FixB family protein [Peribacillus sp. BBB004]
MSKNVLVLTEIKDGKLRNVSLEALTVARQVAQGGAVSAAIFGSTAPHFVGEVSQYGPEKVYVVEDEALDVYTMDGYTQALTQLIEEIEADIVLMGHTSIGKDVTPRVAARLDAGLVSDCTAVSIEDGTVIFTRPIYAGKAFQDKVFNQGKIFATIRANNFVISVKDVQSEIISYNPVIKDLRTVIKDIVRKTAGGVDLSEAKVIVSGGRGVKSGEGFKTLQELAEILGGAVGASRGACDAGFCDYSMQIGQTGKVVTPDLYIACGISGAIQHLAGMSNSKIIVAINKDPEAPIFQIADYGIVGDLFEVVPLLTEEFKKILTTV